MIYTFEPLVVALFCHLLSWALEAGRSRREDTAVALGSAHWPSGRPPPPDMAPFWGVSGGNPPDPAPLPHLLIVFLTIAGTANPEHSLPPTPT